MFLHRWFMLGTTKAPSILKFKNLCKFASCVHGHTDILRKCFSLTLSEIRTICYKAKVGRKHSVSLLLCGGGPLLIYSISIGCGVVASPSCFCVRPERPIEVTK